MGRAAELLDGSAGQCFRAAEGKRTTQKGAAIPSSELEFEECCCCRSWALSIGFQLHWLSRACVFLLGVCGRGSMSLCWNAGWGRQSKFPFPEMVCPAEQWMWFLHVMESSVEGCWVSVNETRAGKYLNQNSEIIRIIPSPFKKAEEASAPLPGQSMLNFPFLADECIHVLSQSSVPGESCWGKGTF